MVSSATAGRQHLLTQQVSGQVQAAQRKGNLVVQLVAAEAREAEALEVDDQHLRLAGTPSACCTDGPAAACTYPEMLADEHTG